MKFFLPYYIFKKNIWTLYKSLIVQWKKIIYQPREGSNVRAIAQKIRFMVLHTAVFMHFIVFSYIITIAMTVYIFNNLLSFNYTKTITASC